MMFGSSLPPVVCRWLLSYLRFFVCVCLRIVVSNTCGVYVLFSFVLCTICCHFLCVFLRFVYHMLPFSLCFSSFCVPYVAIFSVFSFVLCTICCHFLCVFLRFVYHMLPFSLDCPIKSRFYEKLFDSFSHRMKTNDQLRFKIFKLIVIVAR